MDDSVDRQVRELEWLRAENARLTGLLEAHGIAWRDGAPPGTQTAPSPLTTDEKIALFGRLFRGRTDVYPVRWESKAGKSGYSPACGNEWRAGVCEKPRIKCADCSHRLLVPPCSMLSRSFWRTVLFPSVHSEHAARDRTSQPVERARLLHRQQATAGDGVTGFGVIQRHAVDGTDAAITEAHE